MTPLSRKGKKMAQKQFIIDGGFQTNADSIVTGNLTVTVEPSDASHVTTKNYVDQALSGLSQNSISQGDSDITISDSGTGAVVISVDNVDTFTVSATSVESTVPYFAAGLMLSTVAYVDSETGSTLATSSADATTKADAAQAAATSAAATDATAKVAAEATARDSAIAAAMASLVDFHSAEQVTTSAQATTNATATVNFTFADLATAKSYTVYLNRWLLRPAEYSVNGSTVTIAIGVLATDDEIEVSGLKV